MSTHRFVPGTDPPDGVDGPVWWLAFHGHHLLIEAGAGPPLLPSLDGLGPAPGRQVYLGTLAGLACYAAELAAEPELPPGFALEPLRGLFGRLDDEIYALAGRAFDLLEWDRAHQYCGACGSPTGPVAGERARRCRVCSALYYPRISPAVIALVRRGDAVLLGRGLQATDTYSALAGFVEPGESLEEAVAREIAEEAGIAVTDIHYFGSQPWPYSHALMIGFTATYAGGEIRVQPTELGDAGWFTRTHLPPLAASRLSIARRLIDAFLAEDPAG